MELIHIHVSQTLNSQITVLYEFAFSSLGWSSGDTFSLLVMARAVGLNVGCASFYQQIEEQRGLLLFVTATRTIVC